MSINDEYHVPKTGFAGLIENWKTDLVSGFVVFLIALPLCLAIAIASGMPALAGIISAVVGGIFVSRINGSFVTINGPAAGLIVVILGAVEALGNGDIAAGYRPALAAIVIAGIILILFSLLRFGKLTNFFPASAVHGMLAAIGVIIMSKQIHVALGVKPHAKGPLELIAEIPESVLAINSNNFGVALIGIISFGIMILLPYVKNKYVKIFPPPLVVVTIAILLGQIEAIDNKYLIDLGDLSGTLIYPIEKAIIFPDFSLSWFQSGIFWKIVITIALVQGIETLLSASAVDKLDPYHRKTNMNKDLFAVGLGSSISGLLGGLPMIAEIVRSSANVTNGAKTSWANFFHGLLLFIFIVFAPWLVHMIPLAALAAILVVTGYRLAAPRHFKEAYEIGKEQLLIFVVTIIVTLGTDLIIGVVAGILTNLIMHIFSDKFVQSLFRNTAKLENHDEQNYKITVDLTAVFSNFVMFKAKLDKIPPKKSVKIDFSHTKLIDHTVMEHLYHFVEDYKNAGGQVELLGIESISPVSDHPLAQRRALYEGEERIIISRKLNDRQTELNHVAEKLQISFSPKPTMPNPLLKKFRVTFRKEVHIQENLFTGFTEHGTVFIMDVDLRQGIRGSIGEEVITLLLIQLSSFKIPEFTLDSESVLDRVFEKAGAEDIDFDDFPEFSKKYLLRGENHDLVRSLFKPELIRFFENSYAYKIESIGNAITIYKSERKTDPEDIEKMYKYSIQLIEVISKVA